MAVGETSLPSQGNHPSIPDKRIVSLHRLQSVVKRLNCTSKLEEYNNVSHEQLEQGIV
jgi:hypothetical protein